MITLPTPSPHENIGVTVQGNTDDPKKALLLFHGRGATAENILQLTEHISLDDVVVLAPQAHWHEWYPQRFIVPRDQNEPHLAATTKVVSELIRYCEKEYALDAQATVLAGFSQGACVVADHAAREPQTYGGICIFSGGLIGSDDELSDHDWSGNLRQTPVYIGCDENEGHIPRERVEMTASIFERLQANVTFRLYSGLGHAVHPDGIQYLKDLLQQ